MPNASIAVLREEALSASRLVALRKITSLPAACRSNGSLEGEQPRAPGARVTAPAAVAAAAAVADADIALAARVHAVDQLLAAALQPVGLADGGRLDAAPGRLVGAVLAEIFLSIELVEHIAHAHLVHRRVIEGDAHPAWGGDHDIGVAED